MVITSLVMGTLLVSFSQLENRTEEGALIANQNFLEQTRLMSILKGSPLRVKYESSENDAQSEFQSFSWSGGEWQLFELEPAATHFEFQASYRGTATNQEADSLVFLPNGQYTPFHLFDEQSDRSIWGDGLSAIDIGNTALYSGEFQ